MSEPGGVDSLGESQMRTRSLSDTTLAILHYSNTIVMLW
jgi:hypothetical protein